MWERNERFADASEPIVTIPAIAVTVDVHVTLVIPVVEDRIAVYIKCHP